MCVFSVPISIFCPYSLCACFLIFAFSIPNIFITLLFYIFFFLPAPHLPTFAFVSILLFFLLVLPRHLRSPLSSNSSSSWSLFPSLSLFSLTSSFLSPSLFSAFFISNLYSLLPSPPLHLFPNLHIFASSLALFNIYSTLIPPFFFPISLSSFIPISLFNFFPLSSTIIFHTPLPASPFFYTILLLLFRFSFYFPSSLPLSSLPPEFLLHSQIINQFTSVFPRGGDGIRHGGETQTHNCRVSFRCSFAWKMFT